MFNPKELRRVLTAKDFKPFAIHMTAGARYDIRNHDTMMVAHNSVEIGVSPDANGVVERFVRCAIVHITRIEELQAA